MVRIEDVAECNAEPLSVVRRRLFSCPLEPKPTSSRIRIPSAHSTRLDSILHERTRIQNATSIHTHRWRWRRRWQQQQQQQSSAPHAESVTRSCAYTLLQCETNEMGKCVDCLWCGVLLRACRRVQASAPGGSNISAGGPSGGGDSSHGWMTGGGSRSHAFVDSYSHHSRGTRTVSSGGGGFDGRSDGEADGRLLLSSLNSYQGHSLMYLACHAQLI